MKLKIVPFLFMAITLASCKKESIEPKEKLIFFFFHVKPILYGQII